MYPALGLLLSPMLAAAAMSASSVLVVRPVNARLAAAPTGTGTSRSRSLAPRRTTATASSPMAWAAAARPRPSALPAMLPPVRTPRTRRRPAVATRSTRRCSGRGPRGAGSSPAAAATVRFVGQGAIRSASSASERTSMSGLSAGLAPPRSMKHTVHPERLAPSASKPFELTNSVASAGAISASNA